MEKLTFEQVRDWLGSDTDKTDLIDIIQDIANGVYRVEQLQGDIHSWVEEMEA